MYSFPKCLNNWVLKDQVNLTLSPRTKKKKDTFLSAHAHSVICTNSHSTESVSVENEFCFCNESCD